MRKTKEQKIPQNNYELLVKDGKELSGIALTPIKFKIFGPQEKIRIKTWYGYKEEDISQGAVASYAVKPSFTIPFTQDFSSLKQLKQFAQDVLDDVNGCKDKTKKETVSCLQNFAEQHNIIFKQQIQAQDNNFLFDIDGKFPIKFALLIPTKQEQQEEAK